MLTLLLAALLTAAPTGHCATRVSERLDRALVAVTGEDGIHVSWRLLPGDAADAAFELQRLDADGTTSPASPAPLRTTTDWLDRGPAPAGYALRLAGHGELARCPVAPQPYLAIKLEGQDGVQKVGLGDLDGDGRLDYVLKRPDANIDPWFKYWERSPGTFRLEAYNADGRFLWRHDLGWAIERGIWYSPYLVYDFDGDGQAEVAVKEGEGDPRDPDGKVTKGPEWLVVLDGATGAERCRVPWPSRDGFGDGENGYNYASRNQLAVAYLDGKTPFLIALRGTYTVMKAEAYELDGRTLRSVWKYNSDDFDKAFRGQGAHYTHAVDLDGDGRDELVLGSLVLGPDGKPLWCTRLGHPDHVYLGQLNPRLPGLQVYFGYETAHKSRGLLMVDGATGQDLWSWNGPTKHIHSCGLCADIDPTEPGSECYGADCVDHVPNGDRWLHASDGKLLSRAVDFGFGVPAVYWDSDLQRELVSAGQVLDFGSDTPRASVPGHVVLTADVVGDWREEVLCSLPGELRIYTTPEPACDRRVTLLADPLYRLDTAMNAMGYTQTPSHLRCFEAQAANLNLTCGLDGDTQAVRAVVVAPPDQALKGTLRLTSDAGALAPAEFPVDLAPGARVSLLSRRAGNGEARVTAVLDAGDVQRSMTSPAGGLLANGGFERTVNGAPVGWSWWSRDNTGEAKVVETDAHGGRRCAALSFDGQRDWALANSVRRKVAVGQRVAVRGWARSEACDGLELAVVGYAGKQLVTWRLATAGSHGAHGWREFAAEVVVPTGVDNLMVRWTGGGRTRVWLDDVDLTIAPGQRNDR